MSERVKLGHLIDENGNEVPFFKPNGCGCSDMTDRCIHLGGKYNDDCIISELVAKHGMCCCSDTGVSFYVEKPTPTLAEQVKGWLEAGEYVVENRHDQFYGVWHNGKFMSCNGGWYSANYQWHSGVTILHHGDALSTIEWLCREGYECEVRDQAGHGFSLSCYESDIKQIRVTSLMTKCSDYFPLANFADSTITRFYQPKPAPTLAEQVKGWLEAGEYVVETTNISDPFAVLYGDQRAWSNIGVFCNNFRDGMIPGESIIHHGDALSTITWLCEQGYEVEFESRHRGKRIARCRKNIVEIFDTNGDLTLINIALGEYANITITRFYQPKPTPTLAEQVQGWLEAGEYVVETTNISDPFAVLYGDQRAWSNIGVFCNNFRDGMIPGESIIHHGDALSTITWLCEQGYECEIDTSVGKRVVKTVYCKWCEGRFSITRPGESEQCDCLKPLLYKSVTITRFYRPKVETDAQKTERLLCEGFTVETRTPGIGLIVTVPDGNCSHTSYYLDGTGEFCEDSLILDDETYLAHYREPEPEDVLRKMDELSANDIIAVMGYSEKHGPAFHWEKLSDAYAIARWQLIESNHENCVTL